MSSDQAYEQMQRVAVETGFWRKLLYTLNLITLLAAATLMGVAIWVLNSKHVNTVVPEWALQMVVAFGAVVFFISLVGIIGTYKSPEYIVREKCNFWLLIYQVLILACLVITIVAAVAFLSLLQTVDSAKSTQPQGSGASFEEKIKNWGRNNPSEWTDIQNMLKCCGYNDAHDPTLATGDACPRNATNTRTLCKTLLLNQIEDKSKIIGIVAVVVAFVELLTLVASCCVIWTKPVAEPRVSLAEQSYT